MLTRTEENPIDYYIGIIIDMVYQFNSIKYIKHKRDKSYEIWNRAYATKNELLHKHDEIDYTLWNPRFLLASPHDPKLFPENFDKIGKIHQLSQMGGHPFYINNYNPNANIIENMLKYVEEAFRYIRNPLPAALNHTIFFTREGTGPDQIFSMFCMKTLTCVRFQVKHLDYFLEKFKDHESFEFETGVEYVGEVSWDGAMLYEGEMIKALVDTSTVEPDEVVKKIIDTYNFSIVSVQQFLIEFLL